MQSLQLKNIATYPLTQTETHKKSPRPNRFRFLSRTHPGWSSPAGSECRAWPAPPPRARPAAARARRSSCAARRPLAWSAPVWSVPPAGEGGRDNEDDEDDHEDDDDDEDEDEDEDDDAGGRGGGGQ